MEATGMMVFVPSIAVAAHANGGEGAKRGGGRLGQAKPFGYAATIRVHAWAAFSA